MSPLAFVQGPIEDSKEFLRARFALLARPELRATCSESLTPPPLPPLTFDRGMPSESVAALGMVMPLESLARAFEMPSGVTTRHRVERVSVKAAGRSVDADLALHGAVCGDLVLRAQPTYEGEGVHVTLAAAALAPSERERLLAAGLDPAALPAELLELVRIPVPLSPASLGGALPLLAAAMSNPNARISTEVSTVRPAGAAARGDELVAWVEARGRLRVTLQP